MAKKSIKIKIPINLADLQQGKVQQFLVQRISNVDRIRPLRVGAVHQLLEPRVSKILFQKVLDEIEEKVSVYQNIWKLREVFYPNILIDVFSTKGKKILVLSVNLRNYNFFPPQIGLLTPEEKLIIKIKDTCNIQDNFGIKHIIPNQTGAWICTPGTYRYHNHYFDLDRWEKIRYDLSTNIIEIINRIINMIDRTKEEIVEVAL